LAFLDPASGNAVDFAYANANIKFAYGVELRDQGQYGKKFSYKFKILRAIIKKEGTLFHFEFELLLHCHT
jgi:hypothetical protein